MRRADVARPAGGKRHRGHTQPQQGRGGEGQRPGKGMVCATVGGNTPPSPAADVTLVEETVPHFPLLIQTMQAAFAAGIDRIPTGLKAKYNEFSKMIQEDPVPGLLAVRHGAVHQRRAVLAAANLLAR